MDRSLPSLNTDFIVTVTEVQVTTVYKQILGLDSSRFAVIISTGLGNAAFLAFGSAPPIGYGIGLTQSNPNFRANFRDEPAIVAGPFLAAAMAGTANLYIIEMRYQPEV